MTFQNHKDIHKVYWGLYTTMSHLNFILEDKVEDLEWYSWETLIEMNYYD